LACPVNWHKEKNTVEYIVEDTDRKDIEACLDGDKDSYERLVRRYEIKITKLMWRFSRNPAVCEELVQEVFVEAYFSLKSYRGRAPFLHWLRKIGTRVGYRFWKEQEKRKTHISLTDFDVIEKEETDAIDSQTAAEILHSLLARLPQTDRLILTLMYFEQKSTREIAEIMGWNRAMVKMRALRARKKLKIIAERENLLEKLGWIH
jgi:RNA polymerase sigma-70 factor (ECF subfamily)